MTAPTSGSEVYEPKSGSKPRMPLGLEGNRLAVALVAFAAVTVLSLVLYLQPYSWHEPYRPFLSLNWWGRPLEVNIDAGLPEINRPLHAVSVSANGNCIWVAGADAFLAFSADNGNTWTPLAYDKEKGTLSASADNFPCARAAAAPKAASLELIASAYAQQNARPSDAQQQQQAPTFPAGNVAQGKVAPALKVSLEQISFPPTEIGQQQNRSFGVFNTASSVVYLGKPTFRPLDDKEPSPFRPGKSSCDEPLKSQGECTYTVIFDPRVPGKTSWRMEFTDGLGDRYSVALYGEGKAAPPSSAERPPDPPADDRRQTVPVVTPKAPLASPPNFWAIEFESDGNAATLIASGGDLYTSADGGRTWQGRAADQTRVTVGDKTWDRTLASQPASAQTPNSGFVAAPPRRNQDVFEKLEGNRVAMKFNGAAGWAIQTQSGSNIPDRIFASRDSGASWNAVWTAPTGGLKPGAGLYSIHAAENGTLWTAGYSDQGAGLLLRSKDGGAHWLAATRAAAGIFHPPTAEPASTSSAWFTNAYVRLPSPGYLIALILCGYVATRAFREGKRHKEQQTEISKDGFDSDPFSGTESMIGSNVTSDGPLQPGEPDVLELGKIANGLAFFLSNPETKPPLVIGINGRWGSGKSSLMNLLQKKLESHGASPVWFNAWHHQQEDQLLAALLQTVKQQALPSPLLWTGIVFRARLFINRLKRHWPYIVMVSLMLGLLGWAEHRLNQHVPPISVWALIAYFFQFLDQKGPIQQPLTAITSIFAFYGVFSRLLVAFGSNPAALLSSAAGKPRQKDLAEQTSFRERFADEFSDVTAALPPSQRMLILIDDLDRCRPEKVREVMEAVNFLVSSGQCFVVLGMARDTVEHYIGYNFREVVEGMSWEAMGLTDEDIRRAKKYAETLTDGSKIDREVYARALAFARLYMDKLVQIEVTVPVPTARQKEALFEPEQKEVREKRQRVAKLQSLVAAIRDGTQAVIVLGLFVVAAFIAGVAVKDPVVKFVTDVNSRSEKEKQSMGSDAKLVNAGLTEIAKSLTQAAAGRGGTSSGGGGAAPPDGGKPAPVGPTPAQVGAAPAAPVPTGAAFVAGDTSLQFGVLGAWPFGVALLLVGGIALALVLRTPQEDVNDKPVFSKALVIWHPFVMTGGAKNTPRISKRFKNRVRYLAMRQRAIETKEPESAVLKSFRKWLSIPDEPEPKEKWTHIPEQLLVAFAAIDDFEAEWLRDPELFTAIAVARQWDELTPEQQKLIDLSRYESLLDARKKGGWENSTAGQLKEFRKAYFKLSNEVAERQPKQT